MQASPRGTAVHRRIEDVPVTLIRTTPELDELRSALRGAARVAVDTETNDTKVIGNLWVALRVISLAVRAVDGSDRSFVLDCRDLRTDALSEALALIETCPLGAADGWNASFDELVLAENGIAPIKWRDAMLTEAVLLAGTPGFDYYHGLAYVAEQIGVDLSGKGTTQTSFGPTADLTKEQIRYAAQDAVATLRTAIELDRRADEAGLTCVVNLEQAGRPFVEAMGRHGFPFAVDDWNEYLKGHEQKRDAALLRVAELTGGAEETLFGSTNRPSWNPDSDVDLRKAFNEHIPELVRATNGGKLLERVHSVDKAFLGLMLQMADRAAQDGTERSRAEVLRAQAELPKAVLDYRKESKIISTYGENITEMVDESGRIHPRYLQALTATGRLRSRDPNAQNLTPSMKPYIRTLGEGRVFVHADLSQAEQRVIAQLTGEQGLIESLASGGDVHADTAGRMFGLDMAALKTQDPDTYTKKRKQAKSVSFGIPYGLRATALATKLTLDTGQAVSSDEAQELLTAYAKANPQITAWLDARDRYVDSVSKQPGDVDWARSFRLHELLVAALPKRKQLRNKLKRWPSASELADELESEALRRDRLAAALGHEPTAEAMTTERDALIADLTWALSFSAPVVLMSDGTPLSFESRTAAGRRRLFMVPMDSSGPDKFAGVITSAVLTICTSEKPVPCAIRDAFADEHGLDLPRGVDRMPEHPGETPAQRRRRTKQFRQEERTSIVKAFEGPNKPLKLALLRRVMKEMDEGAVTYLLDRALADQVRSQANAYRNAPIQGLVADIVMESFGLLWTRLAKFNDAFPVQSVHDSIVIECDLAESATVAVTVKRALEEAMHRWCPDVRPVADADIRRSVDDHDIIAEVRADYTIEVVDHSVVGKLGETRLARDHEPVAA